MSNKDEHIDWAKDDRDFWTSIDLDNTPFTDWAVTGMFYESLHWVEAFLDTKGYPSGRHSQKDRNMLLYAPDLAAITADFRDLKKDSETARYACYKHTAEEARQLIPLVDQIKDYISQLI